MTCLETFATLRIFSEDLDPSKIAEMLDLESTKSIPRDKDSRYRPRRDTNYWSWETRDFVDSTDNNEHLSEIVRVLDGRSERLAKLRNSGCQIDICNYWVSNGQGGPSLDVAMMSALCKLELPIWWDIYFEKEREA